MLHQLLSYRLLNMLHQLPSHQPISKVRRVAGQIMKKLHQLWDSAVCVCLTHVTHLSYKLNHATWPSVEEIIIQVEPPDLNPWLQRVLQIYPCNVHKFKTIQSHLIPIPPNHYVIKPSLGFTTPEFRANVIFQKEPRNQMSWGDDILAIHKNILQVLNASCLKIECSFSLC